MITPPLLEKPEKFHSSEAKNIEPNNYIYTKLPTFSSRGKFINFQRDVILYYSFLAIRVKFNILVHKTFL